MRKIAILLTIVVIFPIFSLKPQASEAVDGYVDRFYEILPEGLSGGEIESGEILDMVGIEGLLLEIFSAISGL